MVHTTKISIVTNGPNNTINIKGFKYSKSIDFKINPLKNLYKFGNLIKKIFYLGQHRFIELKNLHELNIDLRVRIHCE